MGIMAIEISYLFITPYSLRKSRTGGIIARLLSRTDLEIVGAQVMTFDQEMTKAYAKMLKDTIGPKDKKAADLLSDYVKDNFAPDSDGLGHRVMMLLFKGEDACRKLSAITGKFKPGGTRDMATGETIRDTYADYVLSRGIFGKVRYFEPAVLTPPDYECAKGKLKVFAEYAMKQSNIVDNIITHEKGTERTLVIIKPDNWRRPSTRPGNIIDMLSRTGLRIVGCKIHRMPVADALEFYGPVKDSLRSKLAPSIGDRAKDILEKELGIPLSPSIVAKLTEDVGVPYADVKFADIIEFMSGIRPESCPEELLESPGQAKCMIMIYEGKDAISKIRQVLGPTDPTKAPSGTIRREFGSDIMVNTAHASDAPESVEREMKVVKIEHNTLGDIILEHIAG
jgi:nucleoside diphosphate kinase